MAGAPGIKPDRPQSDISSPSMETEEDLKGLRHVRDDVPWRLWVVAFISFWERATFWGITAPWQNYMQNPPASGHQDTPGALDLGQSSATRIYCAFFIGYYVAPLGFSVLSDSYLGRYKTLILSLFLYAIGCTALTISSIPSYLAKGWGLPGLVIAMVCIALGGGGFQANIPSFLADQCIEGPRQIKTLRTGERVVTDRSLTLQYIYNLNFWLGNVGSLIHFATVTLEKIMGFTAAFALTGGCIAIAALLLLLGGRWYVRLPHEENVYPQATRIFLCASRNGFQMARAEPVYQLQHRHKTVPWSSQLVNELRRALRASRVLLAFIVYWTCFDQMQNNLISQAGSMKGNGTPNDMLPAMNQVGCIIFVPLVQHGLLPTLHKRGIYPKTVTRIAVGFGFMTMAMLYASVVQHLIYQSGPCYEHPRHCASDRPIHDPNDVNVWIQTPVYLLLSLSEIFAWVTAIEYAYETAPKDMKTVVQAISLLIAGMGSAIAMSLTPVAHDPHMVIFYASLASAMAATGLIFYFVFRNMDQDQLTRGDGENRESMPLQGMKNEAHMNAATRHLHLSIEPPSPPDLLHPTGTKSKQHHVTPPESVSSENNSESNQTNTEASTKDTHTTHPKRTHTRHTRASNTIPFRPPSPIPESPPSSPIHSLAIRDSTCYESDKKSTRIPSSPLLETSGSSGYDTADEHAARGPLEESATPSVNASTALPLPRQSWGWLRSYVTSPVAMRAKVKNGGEGAGPTQGRAA
ncbi:MFS general substrate transporter [Lentithecium fluviatile CBS 122367]|uniref:MFS general substrate transporter n=1 Tax=Lentithecium fluviatile CBS 122367 TaxID=1168545 RepID=A0A6G1J7U7_9PLEO|nr:MFS general substrate transporter [Lentithecium fluviatile CBS 122367]